MTRTDKQALREELTRALRANAELYRTGQITRDEWVATNRQLADQAEPIGWTLPAFALA